jgi:hypothetical protein
MEIKGENTCSLILHVTGYMVKDSSNEQFASDWLNAQAIVKSTRSKPRSLILEFLLIEELEQLREWIIRVAQGIASKRRFLFIDSTFSCMALKRGGSKQLKWIVKFGERDKECIDYLLNQENYTQLIAQLDSILLKFPCRCHHPHQTLSEVQHQETFGLIYDDYPDAMELGIVSRQFHTPPANKEEELAGNLYLWLNQTYRVLWSFNKNRDKLTLFTAVIVKLGERFATLEGVPKSHGASVLMDVILSLAREEKRFVDANLGKGLPDISLFRKVLNESSDELHIKFLTRYIDMFLTKPKSIE